ncbi:hypothetical protein MTR67_013581 [Solanum verrucosum]|uniref:DUF4283 domain-containing protein n=1 Tax=Solanum verrucosum TaxID=315347 RepID=A0AAF0TI23_SOLVR|nr:hypothetical protein MTR67_013581 [Solanum verrucosum]
MKSIMYLHGEPRIIWEEEEVEQMIIKENLAFAVIGKFSYGCPTIQDLRKIIPKQCDLKGECNIGLLSNRHVLIRASCLEDYVNLLSKPAFYLMISGWSYTMRTLKWEPMFNPEEETSTAIAWISFPALPLNFFVKEAVFSLAAAVGKPLQVDLVTKNQTRPSCARVKVEVDLLREFPHKIIVGVRKRTREVVEKNIQIKYDYLPKYCKNCKIRVTMRNNVLFCILNYTRRRRRKIKGVMKRQQKRRTSSHLSRIFKTKGKIKILKGLSRITVKGTMGQEVNIINPNRFG